MPLSQSDQEILDQDERQWDLVVDERPPRVFDVVKAVPRYFDLLWLLVRRDLVATYKQTILGPLWILIQPVFMAVIYVVVFGNIAKLSTDGLPQGLFYLSGITLWSYISASVASTGTVFRDSLPLFSKVYFPRIVVPLSIVISNLVRFSLQFALFSLVLLYYWTSGTVRPTYVVVFFPIVLTTVVVYSLSLGLLVASVSLKYRDLIYALPFLLQLAMYASPVIYPLSAVPDGGVAWLKLNPLAPLFETMRFGFLGKGSHSATSLAISAAFAVLLFGCSITVFTRLEASAVDTA